MLEKFFDLCVVNKTCISLTTVTEKNPCTTKLAYEVKETDNSLTSCEHSGLKKFRSACFVPVMAINKPDFMAGYSLFYESARYGGDFMAAIENNRDFSGSTEKVGW